MLLDVEALLSLSQTNSDMSFENLGSCDMYNSRTLKLEETNFGTGVSARAVFLENPRMCAPVVKAYFQIAK